MRGRVTYLAAVSCIIPVVQLLAYGKNEVITVVGPSTVAETCMKR